MEGAKELGEEALSPALRQLASELDQMSGRSVKDVAVDGLPELAGTDFRILAQIGSGGFGMVYRAIQASLDRVVAVKVLAASFFRIPTLKAQFEHEARLVARLHHPNIIPVFAAGTTERHCFFAMEYIDGVSADRAVFESAEALLRFGVSMAEALAYAHQCGVIHRDVKPSNILMAANGTAKIGDFGLACLLGAHPAAQSSGGTRKYMAPEQATHGQSTTLSDQYALGVTLLELATKVPTLAEDADFRAILEKATAEDPAGRYANMEAFAADLRRCLAHEPVAARPAGLLRRVALWCRRNPAAACATLLAVLCLGALVGTLTVAWRRGRQALAQVEQEAALAAQALAEALTESDAEDMDKRDAGLKRAEASAQALATRFPGNSDIRAALEVLQRARRDYLEQRARRQPRRQPPPGVGAPDQPGPPNEREQPRFPRGTRRGNHKGTRGEEHAAPSA